MWIFVIIVVVVLLIIITSNNTEKKFIKKKVAFHGGMQNLFRILIDGLSDEDGNPEIIQISDDSISVGIVNFNDSAIFRINQHLDKVLVVWTLKKLSLGNHELRWEFPDGLDQNEMLRTIKSHVINYLQNLPKVQAIINEEASQNETALDQREISLKKLASTFNCNLYDVQDVYYKKLDDSKPTKNELDLLLNIYSSSIFDQVKNNKCNPKNTVSGIVYDWTIKYSRINKIGCTNLDVSYISELYDTNPSLLIELIDAKNNNNEELYNKLLSNNRVFLDLAISKLADLSEEKTSYDADLLFKNALDKMYDSKDYINAIDIINKGIDLGDEKSTPDFYRLRSECNTKLNHFHDAMLDINDGINLIRKTDPGDFYKLSDFYEFRSQVNKFMDNNTEAKADLILAEEYKNHDLKTGNNDSEDDYPF